MDENQFHDDEAFYQENKQADQGKEAAAKTLAAASMILGILSIVSVFCFIPFVFSAIGITLAILSKGASKYYSNQGRFGLLCSIIGLAASFILTIFVVVVEFLTLFSGTNGTGSLWENVEQKYEQQYEDVYGKEMPQEFKDLFQELENADE